MAEREPTHTAGKLNFPGACWRLLCALGLAALSACGGTGGGTSGSGPTVTVGGRASGVQEPGLVLQLNGGHDLSVDIDRPFTFDAAVPSGSTFDVAIVQQPPSQRCELVNRGSGVAGTEPVLDVGVVCNTLARNQTTSVRGEIKGVLQPGVLLTLRVPSLAFDEVLRFDDDAVFEFTQQLPTGAPYVIEVQSPPLLVCDIFGGAAGTVGRSPAATVACAARPSPDRLPRRVGGKVQGAVPPGAAVRLRLNGRIEARTSGSGAFTFSEPLPTGSRYEVGLLQSPSGSNCELARAAGVVGDADITDIEVNCQALPPTNLTRGEISGLKGSGLTLRQGLETLTLSPGSTGFTFLIPPENGFYQVEIAAQPTSPAQICEFTNGIGLGFLANSSSPIAVSMTCSNLQRPLAGVGLSLDQNSLAFSADVGSTVASRTVFGAVKGVTLRQTPKIQVSPELVGFRIAVDQLQGQVAKMAVTPPIPDLVGPGTVAGRITITQCVDDACLEQVTGSPQVVDVTYTVRPSPAPRALLLSEHGLALTASPDGSLLTRSLTVQDSGTAAAGWRATADVPWLTITPRGENGHSLQVTADPSGLPDGEHQAMITVRSVDPTLPQSDHVRVMLFKTGVSRTNPLLPLSSRGNRLVVADPVQPLFYRFTDNAVVATNVYTGADRASLPLTSVPNALISVDAAAVSSDGTRLYVLTVLGSPPRNSIQLFMIDLQAWKILRIVDGNDLVGTNSLPGSDTTAVSAVVSGRNVVILGGVKWDGRTPRVDAAGRNHVILDGETGAVLGHLQQSAGADRARLFAGRDPSTVFVLEPTGVTQYVLRANAIGNVGGERVGDLLAVKDGASMAVSPDGRKLAITTRSFGAQVNSNVCEFTAKMGRFEPLRELTDMPEARIDSLRYDNIGRLAFQFLALDTALSTIDLYNIDGTRAKRVMLPAFLGASGGITFTSDGLILSSNDQLLGVPPP